MSQAVATQCDHAVIASNERYQMDMFSTANSLAPLAYFTCDGGGLYHHDNLLISMAVLGDSKGVVLDDKAVV